ncbi:hypothetical protein [Paenibacillus sp. HJGM_3]|uniref:hypothetical protein n=1 Tax=Paenibacillus sp. HJGM_3 TaxID=3379816 RepID=UPI00385A46DA
MKTAQEIERLKQDWLNDPCFDLAETEGFENHKEELLKFQQETEAAWKSKYEADQAEIDTEAERIGVKGLYRIVLAMQKVHGRAIQLLTEGKTYEAYRALQGYVE